MSDIQETTENIENDPQNHTIETPMYLELPKLHGFVN